MADGTSWRNRIVGEGEQPASQFIANPANWRTHPQAQRDAMRGALNEVGWVQRVIVNRQTGYLVDGHERVWQALQNGDAPVPYVEVDLSPEEEAYVLATLDPIGAMAAADKEQLDALLHEVQSGEAGVQAMLAELAEKADLYAGEAQTEAAGKEDEAYTQKITSPVYKPSGPKPQIGDLYDDGRTRALVEAIRAAEGITEEERAFLTIAAQRHTVLHYNRIADLYAHAGPKLQRLMEDSALVIIDFGRAIELGYVRLAEEIGRLYGEDYGNGS